jgi:RimJ/RimL family protein N-acetyltransferase
MGFDRCGVSDRMGGRLVSGPEVGHWVAGKMNGSFSSATGTAIGLERDGSLVAGVMYENWNQQSITAHMAITGRLTRSFLGAIFRYAFEKCGVHKVILPISSGNAKSNKFAQKLGFTEEARIRDAAPDGDIVIFCLAKNECKYLGKEYA